MATIEELLHRRADLSTFVVHLTSGPSAETNLVSILSSGVLEARNPYGMAAEAASKDARIADTQRVVCFSETPLEHVWMMCQPIDGRARSMAAYGLAFTKSWARSQGVNPVWYLDISQRGRDWLTKPVNAFLTAALAEIENGSLNVWDAEILKLTPFIEQMGPTTSTRKEFWWEREWRRVGNLPFDAHRVVAVFAPLDRHAAVTAAVAVERTRLGKPEQPMRPLLDPAWGLERMLTRLAGVADEDAGPFPRSPSDAV